MMCTWCVDNIIINNTALLGFVLASHIVIRNSDTTSNLLSYLGLPTGIILLFLVQPQFPTNKYNYGQTVPRDANPRKSIIVIYLA